MNRRAARRVSPHEPGTRERCGIVHPYIAQPIAEQRQRDFLARADAHRLAMLARSSEGVLRSRRGAATFVTSDASVEVRPIAPSDGDRLERLAARMSAESRRFRCFGAMNRLSARDVEH